MLLTALLLAAVQGVAEFLPVSSSGHLALLTLVLGTDGEPLLVITALHTATALAAVVYYRRAYWRAARGVYRAGPPRRFLRKYAGAQVITALVGLPLTLLLLYTPLAQWRLSAGLLGGMMLLNAAVLLIAPRRQQDAASPGALPRLAWRSAVWVGLAQGMATLPGLSRSGLTVAAGLQAGLSRADAASLSFLLAPPVIVAAAAFWSVQTWPEPLGLFASWPAAGAMLAMTALTFCIALAALHWVVTWVRAGRLWWFAPWSAILGLATLATALR